MVSYMSFRETSSCVPSAQYIIPARYLVPYVPFARFFRYHLLHPLKYMKRSLGGTNGAFQPHISPADVMLYFNHTSGRALNTRWGFRI